MASTYLQRTLGTPTSQRIFTISAWIKRGGLTAHNYIIGQNSTNESYFRINDADQLDFQDRDSGVGPSDFGLTSNALLRDVGAWYHVVLSVDTTQATNTDRGKLYINGQLQTLSSSTYPPQNYDTMMNLSGATQRVGRVFDYFDGSMAHVHFIDGTAYDASAFGETDATTGIWKPKTAPSVTYGTNGFFLKFANSGSMGTDSSGNGNNFTVNGTMTQTIDTPSNVFATWNPLKSSGSNTVLTNGNLTNTNSSATWGSIDTGIGASSGKYYAEFKILNTTNFHIGINAIDNLGSWGTNLFNGQSTGAYGLADDGNVYYGASSVNYSTSLTTNDIVGIAMDLDNSNLYWSKNGTWLNSADPESGATGTGALSILAGKVYSFAVATVNSSSVTANFGNGYFGTTPVASAENPDDGIGIFEYPVPAGYKALCTKSINAQEYA